MEKNKKSIWPYIIIGMLSFTGVLNYLLVYFSNSVYSKPVSASPYNDALMHDQKEAELQCARDQNYAFKLVNKEGFQELEVSAAPLPVQKFMIKGWSGPENSLEEELSLDSSGIRARLNKRLSSGLWNIEVYGTGAEGSCDWRVVVREVV